MIDETQFSADKLREVTNKAIDGIEEKIKKEITDIIDDLNEKIYEEASKGKFCMDYGIFNLIHHRDFSDVQRDKWFKYITDYYQKRGFFIRITRSLNNSYVYNVLIRWDEINTEDKDQYYPVLETLKCLQETFEGKLKIRQTWAQHIKTSKGYYDTAATIELQLYYPYRMLEVNCIDVDNQYNIHSFGFVGYKVNTLGELISNINDFFEKKIFEKELNKNE